MFKTITSHFQGSFPFKKEDNIMYSSFLQKLELGIALIDLQNDRLLNANDYFLQFLHGTTLEEASTKLLSAKIQVFPIEDNFSAWETLKTNVLMHSESQGEWLIHQPNGERMLYQVEAWRTGKPEEQLVIINLKQLEKVFPAKLDNLRKTSLLYNTLFFNGSFGIVNLEGKVIKGCNPSFEHLTGMLEEQLTARSFESLIYREDLKSWRLVWEKMMAGNLNQFTMELRLVTMGTYKNWVSLSVNKIKDKDSVMILVKDIADHKKAREELLQATIII